MSNAVFKYYNATHVLTTYTCIKNYNWGHVNDPIPVEITNVSNTGIIYTKIMFTPRTIELKFDRIAVAQKTAFDAIRVSGLGWLYPDGLGGDGYWGKFNFSKATNLYSKYNISLNFVESKEEPKDANTFLAKIVNNDDENYTNPVLQITVDTATRIAAGTLESDLSNMMIYDGDGAGYDYWSQPDATNSATAKIWVKLGSLKANDTKFLSFNIDNDWNYTQDTANVFTYFEDFSAYVVGSDIDGQGGWTASGGLSGHHIYNDSEGNYLRINALDTARTCVYRTLANIGNSFIFKRFKADDPGNNISYYRHGWGDAFDGNNILSNGFYTTNTWNSVTPASNVQLYKIVAQAQTQLDTDATVQDSSKYFGSYFSWYGQYKRGGFNTTEVTASDSTFSSQDKLFLQIKGSGGAVRHYEKIQYVFTGKTTKSAPTITIIDP